MGTKAKLDYYEAATLADVITGTQNNDEDHEITEQALADKWGISLEDFHEIANAIYQLIDLSISPLSNTAYLGIGTGNLWIAKHEANSKFISSVIAWCTDGECEIKKGVNGYTKEILSGGKTEFEVTITNPGIITEAFKAYKSKNSK